MPSRPTNEPTWLLVGKQADAYEGSIPRATGCTIVGAGEGGRGRRGGRYGNIWRRRMLIEGEGGSDYGDDIDLAALDSALQLHDNYMIDTAVYFLFLISHCTSGHHAGPGPPGCYQHPRRYHLAHRSTRTPNSYRSGSIHTPS